MIKLLLLACAILLVTCQPLPRHSLPYAEEHHIINMGSPTWNHALNDFPGGMLVYFYHPLCNQCKVIYPEILKSAQELFELHSAVQFAKIDCHDEIGLCQSLHVNEYPTLVLYRVGAPGVEYRGYIESEDIMLWIRKVVDSGYEAFYQEKTLFKKFATAIIVNDNFPADINIAYRDLVTEVEIGKGHGQLAHLVQGFVGAIYSQGGHVEKFNIDEKHNADWLRGRIRTLLYEEKVAAPTFGENHWGMLQYDGNRSFVFFFRTEKFNPLSDAAKAFDSVNKQKSNNTLMFTYVNTDEIIGDTVSHMFDVSHSDQPTIGILSKQGRVLRKYKLDSNAHITEETINGLLNSLENNQHRYYKGAAVPKLKKPNIQELVRSNFNETISSGKNVLVLFYFQKDAVTAQTDNTWESIAYRFRRTPNLVVARIDMAENDLEGVEYEDYPVVRLYRPDSTYVEYTSRIDVASLMDLISEKAVGLDFDYEL